MPPIDADATVTSPHLGAAPAPADETNIRVIGRYVVLRVLGRGGMGSVFAAYDEELDRRVAIKVLHGTPDPRRQARVLREAKALARVSHPNVVSVYEVGQHGEDTFIAMEFVEGTTLAAWELGRSWEEVLAAYLGAGEGLHAVHEAGLVHRDFKPENVLVSKDGRARVADFGLAKSETEVGEDDVGADDSEVVRLDRLGRPRLAHLTAAGTVAGTPAFMSPEQYSGLAVGARSNKFSFCVALYKALYRRPPFGGDTVHELQASVVAGRLEARPETPPISRAIHDALARGMRALPESRFATMRELLVALAPDDASHPAASPTSRRRFTAAILTFIALTNVVPPVVRRVRHVPPTMPPFIVATSLSCVGCFLFAYVFRKTLFVNRFHRGMLVCALIWAVETVANRVVGLLAGISVEQVMALDFVGLTALGAVLGIFFLPGGPLARPTQHGGCPRGRNLAGAGGALQRCAPSGAVRRRLPRVEPCGAHGCHRGAA